MRGIGLAAAFAAFSAAPAAAQTPPSAADIDALRAELQALRAKVDALESQLEQARAAPPPAAPAAPAAKPATEISWRGAPRLEDKAKEFSFKPRGFLQVDSGIVGDPRDSLGGVANLGWRTRARRLVFGAEGGLPGGFDYKIEFNFADGRVGFEDVVLNWQPDDSPLLVTVGNMFPLAGMDPMTSSRLGSFVERSIASDAFTLTRRVGATVGLVDPKDGYTLTAGLFQTGISDDFGDNAWQASARGTWSPKIGEDARLHFGASYQHRRNRSDTNQARYRARPFTNVTDFRFVDTGSVNSSGDDILGLEFAAILGPFHVTGEGHRLWVRDYRPPVGAGGGVIFDKGPVLNATYAEAGWLLTGETRGYKAGKWDRVKVARPLGGGGWGALQFNGRIEWLDLTDMVSDPVVGPLVLNGGRQTGYSASLIWNPIDYVRVLAQYSRIEVEGGPQAGRVAPGSPLPLYERGYGTDVVVVRTQVEF